MKHLIITLTFISISIFSFGQFSRSFYLTENNKNRRHDLIEHNGEIKLLSIHESSNDTLRITSVTIDDNGETTNYSTIIHTPFQIELGFGISGIGINPSGNPVICINQQVGSDLKVQYVTVDISANSVVSVSELPYLYRVAGVQSRVKGDSMISYFMNNTPLRIERVSTSLSNTANYSWEIASDTLSYGGSSLSAAQRRVDLLIDGNDEYINTSTAIIKRSSTGSYLAKATAAFPIGSPLILKNNNGQFVTLTGNIIDVYDSNLNSLLNITLTIPTSFSNNIEGYATPSGYRIWCRPGNASNGMAYFELDNSFNEIQRSITSEFYPVSRNTINGKEYVVGFTYQNSQMTSYEGDVYPNSAELMTVVCDDLNSTPKEFAEYNRKLTNGNIEFFVGHLGRSYTQNANVAGFKYNLNGTYRGVGYASSQYTIGKSINGDLQGMFITYGNNGTFVPGPYTDAGSYDKVTEDKYNRGYYVSKDMIEAHITAIGTSDPTYIIPDGILKWPTNGDVSKGQAENLAAYVDRNNNGIYDPENGDYPSIYGDQCYLNIYHHHAAMLESNSIETHQYYFTFDCQTDESLENTVFIRQHEFTRVQDLNDVYHATFMDFDIGYFADDYAGTNVDLGMIYGYNGDAFDETGNGSIGFNDTLPAFGILALQGMKLPEVGIDRPIGVNVGESINGLGFGDGVPDNEYYTLESSLLATNGDPAGISPNNTAGAYEVMKGNYANGTPQLIDTVAVRHSYLGTSDPLFYSSVGIDHGNNNTELGAGNPVGDRRMFSGSGPTKYTVGDTMILINAYIVGIDTINISGDSSQALLFNYGQSIRDMYSQNLTTCGSDFGTYVSDNDASTNSIEQNRITVYPNPTNSEFKMLGISGDAEIEIIDIQGKLVLQKEDIVDGIEINVSELQNAIYFVQVTDKKGTNIIRLIKN